MDVVLCIFCRPWIATIVRLHSLLWHGLCGYTWYGLGLVDCYGFHPVYRHGHG